MDLDETLGDARRHLSSLSRVVADTGRTVAEEGDRWFLGAVRTADRGAQQTRSGLGALGRYLATESARLRPGWLRRLGIRERMRKTLLTEAKRARLDAPDESIEQFAEHMSVLIELVLTGTIAIDAISFEADAAVPGPESTEEGG